MIHLRPESTAYAREQAPVPSVAGYTTTPDNTVLEQQNPSAVVDSLKTPVASVADSFKATLSESLAAKALRGIEYMDIPSEPGFNVTNALADTVQQYTADELHFLSDARSNQELRQRQTQVQTTRENYSAMGQNMLTTIGASMLDIDMVIGGGVGALSKLSRATRLAVGLAGNSAALGLASQGGTVTPADVIGTSIGVALSAVPRVRRAVSAAERAETRAGATAADATPTAPEAAVKRPEYVPDTDYKAAEMDTFSTKPHIEVGAEGGVAIKTDIGNAVRAVVNVGEDLSEGQRLLGKALADSLEADPSIPVVFRKGTDRSNVSLAPDASIDSKVFNTELGADLTSHVQNMSTYDKSILLHEAAHAKTIRTLQAVEQGAITDGAQFNAVQRIQDIRQYVSSKLGTLSESNPAEYQVKYGLDNNHEFIAQMFNSEDFRTALQGIKMPGAEGTVWHELVRRVVQAFTGKQPEGTAFDALVQEFHNLLDLPQVERTVKLREPVPVPSVTYAPLKAKTITAAYDNTQRAINRAFSLYENIKAIGPKASELAGKLVVDSTGTEASSAAHYARTAHLASNQSIVQVDAAMAQALKADWPLVQRVRHPGLYKEAQRELSEKVYNQLADNHARFLQGSDIIAHVDPRVEGIVKAFADSKWAEDSLQRIKAAGVDGADAIEASPYYLPRQHSGDKMSAFLRNNAGVTRDDVIGMYTSQFKQMFAGKGIEDATARKLGGQMVRNMEQRASHVQGYRQSIAGMSYNDIEEALVNAGVDEAAIKQFMGEVEISGNKQNVVRNLRHRAEFDMTADYTTKSGQLISPQMFVNTDTLGLMEGYSRRMSGRIGLARAGFPDVKSLAAAVDEAAAEAVDTSGALKTLDNTVNQLLGYPTGEDVPDILRSLSVVGGAVNLANSGVYQLADAGLMLQQFGVTKVFKAMTRTKFGRDAMALAKDPEYGSRLADVLESRNVLSGKYRSILTHLEDNKDIGSLGLTHQMIQKLGQGTRFANGMEYVRRGQSKLVAGLISDTMEDAIKGNASAVTAMERFGLNPDILKRLRASPDDMRAWPDDLRLDMETIGHNMADSLVLENRLGEIPAWMQFSQVGKVVLPYMTFVAGAWNKILRRTVALDGATGVALAMAYQMPLTVVSSAAAMGLAGQDITPEKLAVKVATQVPLMSWLGFAIDFTAQGPTNSIAALSIVDKMYSASTGLAKGEVNPESVIKAVPFLGIVPGVRLMATSFSDDDE